MEVEEDAQREWLGGLPNTSIHSLWLVMLSDKQDAEKIKPVVDYLIYFSDSEDICQIFLLQGKDFWMYSIQ